ncbi:MAG: NAD(P)-binding domain-containing protein, partial [Clostridiaceae bacterium]|nr:NAD(P)-binding domain-containing protein [Clostridiaceae bacterium]
MNKKISMIGAGSWGTALSILLAKSGCNVSMWSCFKEEVEMVNNKREHLLKLPGVLIPEGVSCTDNIEDSINGAEAVILVVPSQTIRKSAALISRYIKDHMVVVSCSKGLEEETGLRLSEVIKQEIPQCREVVLSGPSHAEEVARDIPTTVVSAS